MSRFGMFLPVVVAVLLAASTPPNHRRLPLRILAAAGAVFLPRVIYVWVVIGSPFLDRSS